MTVWIERPDKRYCIRTIISDPTLLSLVEIRCYALDAVQNNPIELGTSIAIVEVSVILFWYWFRYACWLILRTGPPHYYSEAVVAANQLSFREVQSRLRKHEVEDLESLHKCLERDFTIICSLLKQSGTSSDTRFEDRMLKIHYRLMSTWFRVTQSFIGEAATQAIEEMSLVMAHFANAIGERSAAAY